MDDQVSSLVSRVLAIIDVALKSLNSQMNRRYVMTKNRFSREQLVAMRAKEIWRNFTGQSFLPWRICF